MTTLAGGSDMDRNIVIHGPLQKISSPAKTNLAVGDLTITNKSKGAGSTSSPSKANGKKTRS
jgi:hypothetical protein